MVNRVQLNDTDGHYVTLEGPYPCYDMGRHHTTGYRLSFQGRGNYGVVQDVPLGILLSLADAIYRQAGQTPIHVNRPIEPEPKVKEGVTVTDPEVETIKARMLKGQT